MVKHGEPLSEGEGLVKITGEPSRMVVPRKLASNDKF